LKQMAARVPDGELATVRHPYNHSREVEACTAGTEQRAGSSYCSGQRFALGWAGYLAAWRSLAVHALSASVLALGAGCDAFTHGQLVWASAGGAFAVAVAADGAVGGALHNMKAVVRTIVQPCRGHKLPR
jgi:hypothetical protein